ncbi:TMS membrane protein/tumor differentially expressed protein [Ceraceosorus guamensis]|uniref:TMS membrane protein/tumor differentially expressed protein n=1 Tax=Ceraceosorus guamensis TaxID=1522189 RepID=A0A316VZ30_9BASI|nr:TMS membrane protein/tumor differentially expressed protein [Ceraceosorus guamensis]PWN42770.1 TMS membrane protein/tumor differentially expressed protein [Ceraceosorus guamensis]
MGALLSIPLVGVGGSLLTSAITGLTFCCASTAASSLFKSCNCQSSIATRIAFALIFTLDAVLAWISLNGFIVKKIEDWSGGYLRMDCSADRDRCYGVLAVHRITFALSLFHCILGLLLIGVNDTRNKRAAIQNGWWGPKVLLWLSLIGLTFLIPNGFFIIWANYFALILSFVFILLGLVLLIDFAHTWSETCLDKWETTQAPFWKYTLIGSTLGMYVAVLVMTGILYGYFTGNGCGLNITFITLNLFGIIVLTALCVSPAVQEANPRSGLAQSSIVAAYTTYLVSSAVMNHDDAHCNPITRGRSIGPAKPMTVALGALFTFLAIAYSTSRAATQSKALVGARKAKANRNAPPSGYGPLATTDPEAASSGTDAITSQPARKDDLKIQALRAAVEAGSLPASALEDSDDEDDDDYGDGGLSSGDNDDEKNGTRYSYAFFHFIFAIAACYVAMLLTDWRIVKVGGPSADPSEDGAPVVWIGRSPTAMWMRVVSSWLCSVLYAWSLIAPVLMPERFGSD